MDTDKKKVNLLLVVHCHQPVSNFPGIFQDAFEKSYLPFLDTFEDFSNLKISFHFSGSLLDWLAEKHPEYIKRLKMLFKEGRIEIIGGGYFEPILAIIPEQDAVNQIKLFYQRLKDMFGCDCKGIWLTERVWEPALPRILSQSGVEYTIVDDYHFSTVGMDIEQLSGYYISEEQSDAVRIFPGSEKLRYLMPFRLPHETIDYLRQRLERASSDVTITFADDGEKFGLWPGTNKWVYQEKWLERFFSALDENRQWINTRTLSECITSAGPTGRVYLSCTSYKEMQEWSRGFFRNFLIKYPEANNLAKKMFLVSKRFRELADTKVLSTKEHAQIQQALYKGQFNDAYWHGIFGGLYLMHLRSGAYEYLVQAENMMDRFDAHRPAALQLDYDKDGYEELIVTTKKMRLYIRPHEGATISEWDDKLHNCNIANTITRRPEYYHEQLKQKIQNADGSQAAPKSIHENRPVLSEGLSEILLYDRYHRYSLRDYMLDPETKVDDFYRSTYKEIASLSNAPYEIVDSAVDKARQVEFTRKEIINHCVVRLSKSISFSDNALTVEYNLENFGTKDLTVLFGTEFNLSLYDSELSTAVAEKVDVSELFIDDLWRKTKIKFALKPASLVWHFPIETVSDSDSGIEKVYQGMSVFFSWNIKLPQRAPVQFCIKASIS